MSEYNLNDYSGEDQEERTAIDNDTGKFSLSGNGIIKTAWETLKAAARYQFVRIAILAVVTAIVFVVTGDFGKSKNAAGEIATKGANDDYFGFFGAIAKETGHTNQKFNMHPFYHTKGVRKLEQKFELEFGYRIKFSKVFAYMRYEDQDFVVMKKAAKGKDKERLSLDNWTFASMSADDYCEDYFDGFLPDKEMEAFFVEAWRVRGIKNKEGQNRFRCVIGPDTIEDYIEDENDRKS